MDQHKFLRQSCISGFEHGKREFGKLIAMILICIQISSPLPLLNWDIQSIHPAKAVLYSPDTKVPRTGELALRRAIPANTSMKAIQVVAEILACTFFFMVIINCFATLFFLLGLFRRDIIFAKDSAKEALWNYGG